MFGLLILIVHFATLESRACSCIEQSVIEAIHIAEVVFVGRVISRSVTSDYSSVGLSEIRDTSNSGFPALPECAIAKVVIERTLKGNVVSDTITIVSSSDSESCGYFFEVGKKYIVYARQTTRFNMISPADNGDVRVFGTSICTRTRKWNQEEVDAIREVMKK